MFENTTVDFSSPKFARVLARLDAEQNEAILERIRILGIPEKCGYAVGCDKRGRKFTELVGERDPLHPEDNPLDALLEHKPLEKVGFMLRATEVEGGLYIGLVDGKRNIAVMAFTDNGSLRQFGLSCDSLNASEGLAALNTAVSLNALDGIALLLGGSIQIALKHAGEGRTARVSGLGSVSIESEGKLERVFLEPREFFDLKSAFCKYIGIVGKDASLRRISYLIAEAHLKGYPGLNPDEVAYDEKSNNFVRKGAAWSGEKPTDEMLRQSFLTFLQGIYVGESEKQAMLEGWREAFKDAKSPQKPDELFARVFPKIEYSIKEENVEDLFG